MKNPDMIKRYTMFMAGVIASALGISLITKAGLGTSPVTSPAFVLTFLFPYSLGTFTMMVNTLMSVSYTHLDVYKRQGLHFAHMGTVQQQHAQPGLADAAADGVGQLAV